MYYVVKRYNIADIIEIFLDETLTIKVSSFTFYRDLYKNYKESDKMEKVTVFLGGTCADSTWREELIPQLEEHVEVFNPQLPEGAWNEEAQKVEDYHRETDDICLYVITPEGEGFYSFVEVTDDSNKRPERTILCVLESANGKTFEKHVKKCALKTMSLVAKNGVKVFDSLEDVAAYLNQLQFGDEPRTK